MARAQLRLEGTAEFTRQITDWPGALADGARLIVYGAAQQAVNELRDAYPPRRPKSRSRFEPLQHVWYVQGADRGPLRPRAFATHREILAVWREQGTKPRLTTKGWSRGRMPPAPVFVPIRVRWERFAREALIGLAETLGFTVKDDGR